MTPEQARTCVEEFEAIRAALADWSGRYGVPGLLLTVVVRYETGPEWHAPGDLDSPEVLRLAGFRATLGTGERPLCTWLSPTWPLIRASEWVGGAEAPAGSDEIASP